MANPLPDVECGQLFCRLGCVCDSLKKAEDRHKISHCSRPECMALQCVCGYQKGNPSSRRCFASLLKGNESFYSKIDWSASGRQRRERRIPERFSEYHLGGDISPPPRPSSKNSKGPRPSTSRPSSPLEKTPSPRPSPTNVTPPKKPTLKKKVMQTAAQVPLVNTSSRMRQLLQRFNLPQLVMEERGRTFEDEVDLNVRRGQTVQLVAWIRFHRIYQSGLIHIRFRAGPVILVMHPDEIVGEDVSCNIQSMTGDRKANAPKIVQSLLEPFISPEDCSRYAVLFCDGFKWQLVGWINHKGLAQQPTQLPAEQSATQPTEEETTEMGVQADVEEKRNEVVEKLGQIRQQLKRIPERPNHSEELLSNSPSASCCLAPDQFILSDELPFASNSNDSSVLGSPFLEAIPSEKRAFPKILTAKVSCVRSKENVVTRNLKIVLEAISGQPSGAVVFLPLHNIDDRWCLVALDHIPKCGFRVPGLSVFISDDLLGRAASAATERKAKVYIPLRVQLKNKESAFKPNFGVYGTPQLPRHVFVGPFPANRVKNCSPQPCTILLTLEPITTPSVMEINRKDVAVVAASSTAEREIPEANVIESQMAADGAESNKMDTVNETAVEEPARPLISVPSAKVSNERMKPRKLARKPKKKGIGHRSLIVLKRPFMLAKPRNSIPRQLHVRKEQVNAFFIHLDSCKTKKKCNLRNEEDFWQSSCDISMSNWHPMAATDQKLSS